MTELPPPTLDDATRARAELALCGLMAYRELTAFERLSSDARFSPTIIDRVALARLAVHEFGHYERVVEVITSRGAEPTDSMEPFVASIDALHDRTRPGDWYESLMKAHVIDSVSGDFYVAISRGLDPDVRGLVQEVQALDAQNQWLHERLQEALAEDPRLASRLALWGRRLLGEALTQARRIADSGLFNDALITEAEEAGEEPLGVLFAQLVENHSRRMAALGLTA